MAASIFNRPKTKSKQAASTPSLKPQTKQWTEKYRPKNLSQVSSQEHTVAVLKKTLESQNLSHCLFYGPPGTGKTSTILALARELFGPELIKTRVLELNASDERGISIVREKVKNFARSTVTQPVAGYPCPPYKIIILDEADSMTQDAQSALRRTMETYSHITRFCLICNYVTRIIDPLASRCSKFRFKSLDTSNAVERLEYISKAEKLNITKLTLEQLALMANGDLRRAITILQSANTVTNAISSNGKGDKMDLDDEEPDKEEITLDLITEIAGLIPSPIIDSLISVCQDSNNYKEISQAASNAVMDGYSAGQILLQLHDEIVKHPAFTAKQQCQAMMVLGEADRRLVEGADEELQLLNILVGISTALQSS